MANTRKSRLAGSRSVLIIILLAIIAAWNFGLFGGGREEIAPSDSAGAEDSAALDDESAGDATVASLSDWRSAGGQRSGSDNTSSAASRRGADPDNVNANTEGTNARLKEMPATARGNDVVSHTGYTLCFNPETNCPAWVAWELTRAEASAHGNRNDEFFADPDIAANHRVTFKDYSGSGYTRGHMCPAGDMKWSRSAMNDCFYMSNMCPQLHDFNAGVWEDLESACRRWARRDGSVYICCGPVFKDGRKTRTIGRQHKVRVPDGFFKVVLSLRKGQERAIGFYFNHNEAAQNLADCCCSVDDIEEMTGLDFFCNLPDKQENRLERQFRLSDWE